jgi:hypothetical protein
VLSHALAGHWTGVVRVTRMRNSGVVMTPEGRIKAMVRRRLDKEFGDTCYRFMPVQMGYGASTLDFLLCVNGKFIAIETKTNQPGSGLTERQKAVMSFITLAGGLVLVVRDLASLDRAISAIKQHCALCL